MPVSKTPVATKDASRVVAAALAVATSGILPIQLTGAIAPQLEESIGLRPASLGLATTAFFGASVVTSIAIGSYIDRAGWARSMRIAACGQLVALAGIALFARSVAVLAVLLCLGGLMHAIGMPSGNLAIVQRVSARRQAFVFGVRQSAIPIAALVAGVAVPAVVLTVGWRWAYLLGGFGPVLTIVLLRPFARRMTPEAVHGETEVDTDDRASAAPVGREGILSAGLVAMIGATVLGAGSVNVTTSFFVSSVVASGSTQTTSAGLLTLGSVSAIAMRVTVGFGVDRRGSNGFVAMAALLLVGCIGWALLASGDTGLILIATPLAFGAGTGWAGLMHFILVSQHPDNPGAASATVLAFGYAGGAIAPLAFGFTADHVGYAAAWSGTAAAGVLASITTLVAGRLFRRQDLRHPIGAVGTTVPPRS